MKKLLLLLIVLSSFHHLSFSQNKKMDSLNVELKKATRDTTRLRIYLAIFNECGVKNILIYAEPAMKLVDKLIVESKEEKERMELWKNKTFVYNAFYFCYAEKNETAKMTDYEEKIELVFQETKDTDNIVSSLLGFSIFNKTRGNFPKALEDIKKALSFAKKMNYKKGIARCLNYIGEMYRDQGEKTQAMENYQLSLSVYNEIKDTSGLVNLILSMGGLTRTLDYYNKALALCNPKEDKQKIADIYRFMGQIYSEHKDYTNALVYQQKSLLIYEEMKDKYYYVVSLNRIGQIYLDKGDFINSLDYFYKALKLTKEIKAQDDNTYNYNFICSYVGLAHCYVLQKNYTKAKQYSDSALVLSKQNQSILDIRDGEQLASQVDSASGDFKDAYLHYQQYIILSNKLKSDDIHKAATQEKFNNENEKQKAEQDKKDILAKAESKKQKLIILFVALGLLFVLVFAGFIFRSLRITNKQKDIIQEKNIAITDSISYALRIQTAILPSNRIVKQYLENSFILYKPKDIVAGDFYWMETIQCTDETMKRFTDERHPHIGSSAHQIILFAACDCTGQGVPGAMVSVVCHNALNRAVREFGLTQPAAILDKTAEIVIENFSKSEEDIMDGMDISLCSINFSKVSNFGKVELQWAGANNPLWLLQNGELIETKADKQPIGMNDNRKPFTNHTFNLNSTDTIYLFTDGFADQFGGDTGEKKLTKRRFKELILSVQNKTLQEQGIALDKFITDYRKEVEQIDDILVMGVKV